MKLESFPSLFMHSIQKFEISKSCFNNFHPVYSFFVIFKFTIFLSINVSLYILLSINVSLYILWIRLDKFSPWQWLVLSSIGNWGYQDNFKPVYGFLRKSFTLTKTLTRKNKLTKQKQANKQQQRLRFFAHKNL